MKARKQSISKIRQMGFTAIELMVVLIVGIGIYALSTGKISMLFSSSEIAEESGNLSVLSANLRTLKTTSGYGAAGTNLTASLIAVKGVPTNMSVVSGVIYNTWGGTVVPTSTGAGYAIAYSNAPVEGCVKLATKMSTGGTFSTTSINGGGAVTGEVTTAVATTQCSTTTNTLTFSSAS